MVLPVRHRITGLQGRTNQKPLENYRDIDAFKIYVSDLGLLCARKDPVADDILYETPEINDFKGGMAENYVNVLLSINGYRTYYWQSERGAEIDFIIQCAGKLILFMRHFVSKKEWMIAHKAKTNAERMITVRPCVFCCLIFRLRPLAGMLHVEFRIDCVEVFGVEVILNDSQTFAEALIVHDFALTQEADRVEDIRVVAKTDDVVVGRAGFLLGSHVFRQVGNGIALRSKAEGVEREACRSLRVNAGGMVYKICLKTRLLNLFKRHVAGKLMNDGRNHL